MQGYWIIIFCLSCWFYLFVLAKRCTYTLLACTIQQHFRLLKMKTACEKKHMTVSLWVITKQHLEKLRAMPALKTVIWDPIHWRANSLMPPVSVSNRFCFIMGYYKATHIYGDGHSFRSCQSDEFSCKQLGIVSKLEYVYPGPLKLKLWPCPGKIHLKGPPTLYTYNVMETQSWCPCPGFSWAWDNLPLCRAPFIPESFAQLNADKAHLFWITTRGDEWCDTHTSMFLM